MKNTAATFVLEGPCFSYCATFECLMLIFMFFLFFSTAYAAKT